jgi:hypothetical protein
VVEQAHGVVLHHQVVGGDCLLSLVHPTLHYFCAPTNTQVLQSPCKINIHNNIHVHPSCNYELDL